MSWFASVNIDDIPDNPNELPNNTYKFKVTSAKVGPTKDGSKTGISFKYQIIEGSYSSFFPLNDWCRVPDNKTNPDEVEKMLSYLKMRLLAWGFSIDEIQHFGPETVEQCIGREFYGTTSLKKENGHTNIRVVKFDPVSDDNDTQMIDFGV
ncbi:hypothetical protein [Streptomyces hebeiensis]